MKIEEKRNIMIDIETIGRKPGYVILSIAAVEFDIKTGTIIKSMCENFNLAQSLEAGFKIDSSTLKWWAKQDPEIFKQALTSGKNSNKDVLEYVTSFIKDGSSCFVWANSPTFDLSLLEAYYNHYKLKTPWNYTNEMDVRTISNLYPHIRTALKKESKALHDPLEDCRIQIETLKQIFYEQD